MKKTSSSIRKLFFLLIIICSALHGRAQNTVTGTVNGENNAPVQGAAVVNKNSGKGTITDAEGKFAITAKKGEVLAISYVGFASEEITVGNNRSFAVTLKADNAQLTDVVVTATGIKKEAKRLGYAVQTIDATALTKAREPNPVNSLKGTVAGLAININQEMGHPAGMIVRGEGSPMFVVDGVAISSDTYNINPDDIETYTVLKGPNAAALYGFQGKDGAIIITTKKGTKDKRGWVIDFNSSTQINKGFIAMPKQQDRFGAGENGKYAYGGGGSTADNYFGNGVIGSGVGDYDYDIWGPEFRGQLLPQYDGEYTPSETYTTTFADGSTYTGYVVPTAWTARGKDNLKRFIQAGLLSTNSISVASSTEKTDVRVSIGNTYQRGIVPNTKLNNANFSANVTQRFSEKFSATAYFNYSRQSSPNVPDVNYGPNSIIYNMSIWGGADWSVDDMRDYWEEGKVGVQQKYAEHYRYNNPWFMSYEWLRGHYQNNEYGYISLNYKLNDKFDFMFRPSLNTYDMLNTEKLPYSAAAYGRESKHQGDYREDRRAQFENDEEIQVRYHQNEIFNFLDVQAVAGANARNLSFSADFTSTNNLIVPGVYAFSNSLNTLSASSFHSNLLVLSAYYSVDLGYKSYVTANVTGRVDKSSSMPSNTNHYYYPSYNLATVISDYVKLPAAISFLKLRASYAATKEGGVSTTYSAYNGLYGYSWTSPYGGPSYGFGSTYSLAATYTNQNSATYTNQLIDPTIYPADRKALEFGADIRFLKNRIGLDVTHYHYKNTSIVSQTISSASGYSSYLTNGDVYTNDGWEVTLNAKPLANPKGLSWNVAANFSTFIRKWVDMANPTNWVKNGSRVDLNYGNGYVRTPDGQLVVDESSGTYIRFSDLGYSSQRIWGHSDPDWQWSLSNTFSYKSFSLHFQFDGLVGGVVNDYVRQKMLQGGRQIETATGALGEARPSDEANVKAYTGEGVTLSGSIELDPITGEITNYKDLTATKNTTKSFVQAFVYKAAQSNELTTISKTNAKLREVTFSYQLPQKLFGNSFIRNASVSLVGRNLLYFFPSRYKDIDVDQYTQDGGSGLQTPTTRSYGFNLNLTF
ncbi:SusC/RagA family TonB-linked outer membrane protein [Parafilimonas sp.]|uniref:SusC/RagA family TonB-linked outer membrane protein n=1 Tax=Parafilimonas sp. TaxID=1969739 RepID=UPI0039E5DE52